MDCGGVVVDWTIRPRRGNVRQWGAFTAAGEPVFVDGRHLVAGKDRIAREAAKLLPSFYSLTR
jgi:hypothetical protein